jgi:hypothetical protein
MTLDKQVHELELKVRKQQEEIKYLKKDIQLLIKFLNNTRIIHNEDHILSIREEY